MKKFLLIFISLVSLHVFSQGTTCETAIIVGSSGCSGTTAYNNTGIAGNLAPGSCFTAGNNNGMWFQFLATSPVVNVTVNGSSLTAPQLMLLEPPVGGCAGTDPFLELACASSATVTATLSYTGLTVGNTYYIYVDGQNNLTGTFQLCLNSPPVPLNDSPCAPYVIPATNFCSSLGAYTNAGATEDNLFSASFPACWTTTGAQNTVFFQFTATGAYNTITVNGSTLSNPQVCVLQTANCSGTAWVSNGVTNCGYQATGNSVVLNANNLTPGQTYLIAVDGGNDNTGTFQLCVNSYTPSNVPVNDQCSNATQLCPGGYYTATTQNATNTNDINVNEWTCNAVLDNVVWFSYVAATPVQDVVFNLTGNCVGNATSHILQFGVFGYSGSSTPCSNPGQVNQFTQIACNSSINTAGSATITVPAASMVAGQTYYLNVDNWPGDYCNFAFSVSGNAGANAGPDVTLCSTAAPVAFTGTPSGGTWSGPGITAAGSFNPSSVGPGTYTVFYAQGPCIDQKVITVSGVNVTVSNDVTICNGSSVNLLGSVNGVNTNIPVTFTNTADIAISATGTPTINSTINVSGITPNNVGTNPIVSVCMNIAHTWDEDLDIFLTCPGGAVLELSTDNGLDGDNYTNTCFSASLPPITSGGAPFTGSFSPEGSFATLNGCNVNGVWTLSITDDTSIDGGTLLDWSITFNNVITPTYVWSPTTNMTNATTLNPTVTPTTTTTYTLTGNIPSGCPNSDQVTITVIPCSCTPPALSVTNPAAVCQGSTVNLASAITNSGAGAIITYYANQTNAQNGTNPISSIVSTSGTYYIRVTDPTDATCFIYQPVVVTINPIDNASFTLTNFCQGASNSASNIATPGGLFSFNPAPGGNVTINGSTGAITNGVGGATYTVQYTTSGTCPASSTQIVTVNALPTFNLTSTNPTVCAGNNGTITLTGLNNSTNYSISYLDGSTAVGPTSVTSTATGTITITGLNAGSYSAFSVTLVATGCVGSNPGPVTLTDPNAPNLVITSPSAVCAPQTVDITASAVTNGSSNLGTLSYWNDLSATSAVTSPNAIGIAGTYYIQANNNGCVAIQPVVVTINTVENPSFVLTDFCQGATNNATNIVTPGGQFSFNPIPGGNVTINSSTGAISNGVGGTTYTVQYTTSGICSASSTQTVTVNALPTFGLTSTNPTVCAGNDGTITLTGLDNSVNYIVSYLDGGTAVGPTNLTSTASGTITLNGLNAGSYSGFSVTLVSTGCVGSNAGPVTLVDPNAPNLVITNPAAVCEPNTVDLTAANVTAGSSNLGTLTYWTDAGATAALSNPTSVAVSGMYYIQSSNAGCTAIEQVIVTINPIPGAPAAGMDGTYCNTWTIAPISASGSGSFTWYSDPALSIVIGNGPSYIPSDAIGTAVYYVTQTVQGCEGPASTVTITIQNCEIIVPTAFTPDGDNVNDYWEIPDLDYVYPNNKVTIYNRWGNVLYESEQGKYASAPWRGDFKGSKMPVGSYYYIIEFNDLDENVEKGIVTIVLEKE